MIRAASARRRRSERILTSRRWQSGTSIDVKGRISKAGDGDVRHALYEAANIMLTCYADALPRFQQFEGLGLKIAKARGHKRACVAVARKLPVIMFAMWRDGSEFSFKEPKEQAGRSATSIPKLIGVTA
jgi:transposase